MGNLPDKLQKTEDKSQLILWVKEAGVFKPAELKDITQAAPWYSLDYTLQRNCTLGTKVISPRELALVSSPYLGPITIVEEVSDEDNQKKSTFQRKREFVHETMRQVVSMARQIAETENVPYFGVTTVIAPIGRKWTFKEEDEETKLFRQEKYLECTQLQLERIKKRLEAGPKEFALHPTAHLYVPNK